MKDKQHTPGKCVKLYKYVKEHLADYKNITVQRRFSYELYPIPYVSYLHIYISKKA